MMLMFNIVLLILISDGVSERPCLSNESVRNLYKSRNTLKEVQTHFGKLVNTLETKTLKTLESDLKQAVSIMDRYGGKMIVDILKNSFGIFKTALGSMEQKIQHLDNELILFGKNIQKKNWIKYHGHCYYYSTESVTWFTAERKCREMGVYLVKIDNDEEKSNIYLNANLDHNYWIGMTDLKKEGEFLWTYDKSKAVLNDWFPQYGSRGNRFNCVGLSIHEKRFKPFDTRCNTLGYRYVCESDVCS